MTREIYGGAMSGTSLDGVDVVLAAFDGADVADGADGGRPDLLPKVLAHVYRPYPAALRDAVLAVCHGQPLTLPDLGRLDQQIARVYVDTIRAAIARLAPSEGDVKAIGVHGQTVYHQPLGDTRFTMQIGDPNHIAVHVGVPVVADFRRRDMALGGQGAHSHPVFTNTASGTPRYPGWCATVAASPTSPCCNRALLPMATIPGRPMC